jgi:carboxyl-terminal processing protease
MNKKLKYTLVISLTLIILSVTFTAGCVLGNRATLGSVSGIDVVDQAWNIIFQDYVEKDKLDAAKLSGGAIEGILQVLDDPYTAYLNPSEYKLSVSDLAGKLEGIGATVNLKDNKITIVAPIEGSPAEKAGIKPGDVILKVDGTSTEGMNVQQAVLLIRGPAGTAVKLLILHEGQTEPVEIEVIRAKIQIKSVRFDMRDSYAYIRISQFHERTDEEFHQALQEVTRQGAQGVILDLRNNPGGYLSTMVNVASYLLKEGAVLHIVSNQGKESTLNVVKTDFTTDLPTVVLVNKYSASASEVLSGALQDYGRATIAGTITFGKGSVNVLRQLKDGSGLYITTARWLTPKGNLIEGKGITPDQPLELEGDAAIQWAIDYLKGKR